VAVDTDLQRARSILDTERSAAEAKIDAFVRRVEEVRPDPTPGTTGRQTVAGSVPTTESVDEVFRDCQRAVRAHLVRRA